MREEKKRTCLNCVKRDTPKCIDFDEYGETRLRFPPTQEYTCCELGLGRHLRNEANDKLEEEECDDTFTPLESVLYDSDFGND